MKNDGIILLTILLFLAAYGATDTFEADYYTTLFLSCDSACLPMPSSSRLVLFTGELCPPMMTTAGVGARALSDCVCVAGAYGNYSIGCVECNGTEFCPQDSAAPIDCPEGYSCTPSVATALAGNWVNGTFELCPTGFFCSSWNSTPAECGEGFFCGMGSLAPEPCPASMWCPNASTNEPYVCPAGSYCELGSASPAICPASKFCPNGSAVPVACDAGYFCPIGSANQTECLAGFVCEMGTGNMTVCEENYFCPAMTSLPISCPVGSYCDRGMQAFPTQCAAGYYGSSPGCKECPDLMESVDQATTCVCKDGLFFEFDNASNAGSVLENGQCRNTSIFCPPNAFCRRDGMVTPCPPGSRSAGGVSSIFGCVCDNGGVILGSECVNGTAAPAAAAAAVSVAVIAGAAAGGVAVLGAAAAWGASAAGLFGGGSAAVAATSAVVPAAAAAALPGVVPTVAGSMPGAGAVGSAPGGMRSMFDMTTRRVPVMLGVPAFLQEIRVDLQRKTV